MIKNLLTYLIEDVVTVYYGLIIELGGIYIIDACLITYCFKLASDIVALF